jgi:hypothetical protein
MQTLFQQLGLSSDQIAVENSLGVLLESMVNY